MRVLVKKLNDKAVIPFKTHNDDFCYDVVATSCEEIAPNVYKYGIGLAFEIIDSLYPYDDRVVIQKGITVRPRSSIWKTGMVLSNSVGTIDYSYRGEVSLVFYHVMTNMPKYNIGDRIGQIHFDETIFMNFEETKELTQTERGENGYGSTGK